MKLIAGLGNPGKSYEKNRHNIGRVVVDKLQIIKLSNYQIGHWERFDGAEICKVGDPSASSGLLLA